MLLRRLTSQTRRSRTSRRWPAVVAVALGMAVLAAGCSIERDSVGVNSTTPNGNSNSPGQRATSSDGRLVAFDSAATNLVTRDANGFVDVFVRDRRTNTTSLVSVTSGGGQADGDSHAGQVSRDGRLVTFSSVATNLGGPGGSSFGYLRDRVRGTTELVTRTPDGTPVENFLGLAPVISANGRFVAYAGDVADFPGSFILYRWDRQTGQRIASHVGPDWMPMSISDDGRFLAASNLCSTGCRTQVSAVIDFSTDDLTWLAPLGDGAWPLAGAQSTSISMSPDGRWLAYTMVPQCFLVLDYTACDAQPAQVRLEDRRTGTVRIIASRPSAGVWMASASVADDGATVAYQDGGALTGWDRRTGNLGQLAVGPSGIALSGDGRSVTFTSGSPGLVATDTDERVDVFTLAATPR